MVRLPAFLSCCIRGRSDSHDGKRRGSSVTGKSKRQSSEHQHNQDIPASIENVIPTIDEDNRHTHADSAKIQSPSLTSKEVLLSKASNPALLSKQSNPALLSKQSNSGLLSKQSKSAILSKKSNSALATKQTSSALVSKESTHSSVTSKPPPIVPIEYLGAPHPLNESQRWNHLCSLNILDTQPEGRFDDLTKLCCMVFKTPIALVSLVDKERQWFKSVQGITATQTSRKSSFCAWTLLPVNPEVLVVENALDDIRFQENPLVTDFPNIRFYAGCPLVATNGLRLGSLCIIDTIPRRFDAESCNMLVNMAEMVVREIEKDKMLEHQKQRSALLSKENTQLLRAIDCFSEGIMLCNLSAPGWPIMFVNEAWEKLTAIDREEGFGKGFWDMFKVQEGDSANVMKQYSKAIQQMQSFELQVFFHTKQGSKMYLHTQFRCAGNNQMDSSVPLIGIPSIISNSTEGGPIYYFAVCSLPPVSSSQLGSKEAGSTPFNLIPTRKPFDDVRLGPLLGKGAFGRVYRGTWNGASVAVKVMEHIESSGDDGEGVSTPLLEAGLHNQISHPNVVQTYKHDTRIASNATTETGKTLMETWMVLEFCNRGSLSDAVERGWFRCNTTYYSSNLAYILATAKEIAGAMCYLHSLGIIHGDLTGNNILLSSSDKDERGFTAKVADFGLSRVLAADATHVNTRTYGTVTHMPPELLLNGTMSKGADVYAFGVVMWEMFTGKRPYQGLSHGQIIHQITSGKTLEWPMDTPRKYVEVVDEFFSTELSDRPTFVDVMDMLEDMGVEDF